MGHRQNVTDMLSLLLLPALLTVATATCPAGWHPYLSSCYYTSTYTASWREARTGCTAMGSGSDLVAIQSEAENTYLTSSLKVSGAWIGLNDLSHENTFVWADGSAAHYVNWADGQPNNLLD